MILIIPLLSKKQFLIFTNHLMIKKIVIGMKSTSIYNFHPSTFLSEDVEIKSLGLVKVVFQNLKSFNRYKGLLKEDKNDRIDTFHIADFLNIERFNKTILKKERYVAIQHLTGSRYQLVHQLIKYKQHFLDNLYYKSNKLFKELDIFIFGSSILDFLSDSLSLDEIPEI